MKITEIPGYMTDEDIKKILKDKSIDLGSSALDLLEERLHKSNARLILRYAGQLEEAPTTSYQGHPLTRMGA